MSFPIHSVGQLTMKEIVVKKENFNSESGCIHSLQVADKYRGLLKTSSGLSPHLSPFTNYRLEEMFR